MLEKKCSTRKLSHLQYFQSFMFRFPFTLALACLTFNALTLTVSASSREEWCVLYSRRMAKDSLWNIKELNISLSPTNQPPPTPDPTKQFSWLPWGPCLVLTQPGYLQDIFCLSNAWLCTWVLLLSPLGMLLTIWKIRYLKKWGWSVIQVGYCFNREQLDAHVIIRVSKTVLVIP